MLPTKKKSKSQTRTKRSHHALKPTNYSTCPKCGQSKLPHAACANCGYFKPNITLKVAKKEESE